MSTLDRLLQLRSMRGKATIIITDDSLEWYWNDERVGKYMLQLFLYHQPSYKLSRSKKCKELLSYHALPLSFLLQYTELSKPRKTN